METYKLQIDVSRMSIASAVAEIFAFKNARYLLDTLYVIRVKYQPNPFSFTIYGNSRKSAPV